MPLLAVVDGERTISSLLSDDEWLSLQRAVRAKRVTLLLACGEPGHLKTRKGTRFFAHNPGSGNCGEHAGETVQHLAAKDVIVKAATAAGWEASPEVQGDGWTADVLAQRGGVKVAFEVQWSHQTAADYAYRQERYAAAGVRATWFARHEDSIARPNYDLPVFQISESDGAFTVKVEDKALPLGEAVEALLSGKIKYRTHVAALDRPSTVSLNIYPTDCNSCGKPYRIWTASHASATGPCGTVAGAHIPYRIFADDRPEARPEVQAAVTEAIRDTEDPPARIGRRSTRASGTRYMAFSCPNCNAVFGDMFVRELTLDMPYDGPGARTIELPGDPGLPQAHWCYDTGNGHCRTAPRHYEPTWPTEQDDEEDETFANVEVRAVSPREAIDLMFGGSYF